MSKDISIEEIKEIIINAITEKITEKINNEEISKDNKISKLFNISHIRIFLENGDRFFICVNKTRKTR